MSRIYVFKEKADTGHYTADVFSVRCFDDRFWKTFKRFMRALKLGHLDPESVAGGAKILSSPEKESDADFMLRELEKSIRLHHTKRVMLFTHSDCGAYGGLAQFGNNKEKELTFHTEELRRAASVVSEHFPDMTIETYFIDEEGVIQIS